MTTETTPMHTIAGRSIPNGTKIAAFYGDGSGAELFLVDDNGDLLGAEEGVAQSAPDFRLIDAGFVYWMKLPDSFKLWFEQAEETDIKRYGIIP